MKIKFCLILITTFRLLENLQVVFSTERQDFEKITLMHVNLECYARRKMLFSYKYKVNLA